MPDAPGPHEATRSLCVLQLASPRGDASASAARPNLGVASGAASPLSSAIQKRRSSRGEPPIEEPAPPPVEEYLAPFGVPPARAHEIDLGEFMRENRKLARRETFQSTKL